jgi:hypothetical protein
MQEVLPGVFHWTVRHPKLHIEVSSYWLEDTGVLIDPLVPEPEGLAWFAERTHRMPRPGATWWRLLFRRLATASWPRSRGWPRRSVASCAGQAGSSKARSA